MKQPKKLTRTQKELLHRKGLDATMHSLVEETDDVLVVVNRGTQEVIEISKKKKR